MTSKDRLLAALRSQPVDHVPLVIHFWGNPRPPRLTWTGERQRLAWYAERGWDTALQLWCGIPPAPEVSVEVHHETDAHGHVLRQVWHTPAGDLTERLRVTDDWPEAQATTSGIGLLHDFRPSRYLEVPFKREADLAALPYLFPPDIADRQGFVRGVAEARALADEFRVPLTVDIRSGLDWLVWLYPAQEAVLRTVDQPALVEELLARIHAAYRPRLELYLECGVEAVIRSGWYESADLWSPALYRRYALPELEWELEVIRQAGAASVYLMDSGVGPLLPDLDRLPFDCLAGIDPATAGGTDLAEIRRRLPGKSLWGGISGPLHLGQGTPAQVEEAVARAFANCGRAGFILGPVVGFRANWPWANLEACARAWRRLR